VAGTIGGLLRRSSCPWSVPLNFGIVFVLGGAIMAGCTVRYVFMRLPDADAFPTERAAAPGGATVIREISSDRDFGVFLAVAALVSLAVQAELFLVPYGLERFSLAASWAGSLPPPLRRHRLDRGACRHLRRPARAPLAAHGGDLPARRVPGARARGAHAGRADRSIGLAGAAFAAGNVAGFNLAMDFAPAERKGSYSGAFWFVTAGFTALGAPAAGLLVDALSYLTFFLITLAAPLAGLLLLHRFADPRLTRP